jgi:polar amino acid transport system permease protein
MWEWDVVWEILPDLWKGLQITLKATAYGITLAMILGLILAVVRMVSPPIIRVPLAIVMDFIRSTPLLVQLIFLFFFLPDISIPPFWEDGILLSGFETGVVALGVHFSTYTAEVYRAGIEGVPTGQWEASTALSISPVDKWTRIVLPQAIPAVIPALGNYLVAMLKEAPILSVVTVIDVLGEAQRVCNQQFHCTEPYTMAGILFIAVSIPASILARTLEARFGPPAA